MKKLLFLMMMAAAVLTGCRSTNDTGGANSLGPYEVAPPVGGGPKDAH